LASSGNSYYSRNDILNQIWVYTTVNYKKTAKCHSFYYNRGIVFDIIFSLCSRISVIPRNGKCRSHSPVYIRSTSGCLCPSRIIYVRFLRRFFSVLIVRRTSTNISVRISRQESRRLDSYYFNKTRVHIYIYSYIHTCLRSKRTQFQSVF